MLLAGLYREDTMYNESDMKIYTIGHSTRELDDFIATLQHYGVLQLVDVRSVPRSRHTPQFNAETLGNALKEHGIDYQHLAELGGLRYSKKGSINMGWRNTSFRGYADYMQTDEFTHGLDTLLALARQKTTAIMCAEAVPWRCHRSMIGDALLIRGVEVIDIFDERKSEPEKVTAFAKVDGTTITYPAYERAESHALVG